MKASSLALCVAISMAVLVSDMDVIANEHRKGDARVLGAEKTERGLAAELGLAEEKRADLKEKMREMRLKMTNLKSEHDAARAALENILDADTVDEAAVWRAVDDLHRIEGEILKTRVATRLKVDMELTPEQRERMKELRRRTEQKRRERISRIKERDKEDRATGQEGSEKASQPEN